jgi:hypothetical protein
MLVNANTVKSLSIASERTMKNKQCMRENDSCRKVIYMGDVQGPEKENNTYVKITHAGMMDSGFIILQNSSLSLSVGNTGRYHLHSEAKPVGNSPR